MFDSFIVIDSNDFSVTRDHSEAAVRIAVYGEAETEHLGFNWKLAEIQVLVIKLYHKKADLFQYFHSKSAPQGAD